MITRQKLYSVPDLRARGWTTTAIERFLPEQPDDTRDNPKFCRAGAPMKFWLSARVHRAERTKGFLAWRAGAQKRKDSARQAVLTRAANMTTAMEEAEITIRRGVADEDIRRLAAATHGGNYRGDPGPFVWSNRKARNCIRHCLTNYEELWQLCNRGTTGEDAYLVLRARVDALIETAYPQYRDDEVALQANLAQEGGAA